MIQTLRWVLICLSCWKSTPSACVRLLALHFQFLNFCTWCSRSSCIEMGDCVAKLLCGKTGMMENVIFLQLQMSPGWGSVWPDVRSFWNLPWHLGSIRAIRSSWPGTISSGGETSGVKHKQNQKSIHPLCEQKVQIPCLGKHFNCGYVVILTTSRWKGFMGRSAQFSSTNQVIISKLGNIKANSPTKWAGYAWSVTVEPRAT